MTWRYEPPADLSCRDVLDFLRTLPDASVDLVATDPPYGLSFMGSAWDDPDRQLRKTDAAPPANVQERSIEAFKSFSEWATRWATECRRVLRPGGYLLAMAGTRTYDALAWGIRMAGFEIRDTVAAPGVALWVYGSGMPHSKAELKSAFEFVCVARAPFPRTLAENLRTHGTGDLDIDAGRIPAAGAPPGWLKTGTVGSKAAEGFQGTSTFRMKERTPEDVAHVAEAHARAGRWPPDYVTLHAPGCVRVGTRKIAAITGTAHGRMAGKMELYGHTRGSDRAGELTGYGDAAGKEEVDVWRCAPECPVPKLDGQVGKLKSGKMRAGALRKKSEGVGFQGSDTFAHKGVATKVDTFADAGGPSRFFTLPDPDAPTLEHSSECAVVGHRALPGDNRGDPGGRRSGGFLQPFEDKGDAKPNARVYPGGAVPVYECAPECPVAVWPLDPPEGKDASALEVGFYQSKVYPKDRALLGYRMIVPKHPKKPDGLGVDEALAAELCALWGVPVGGGEVALSVLTGWPIPEEAACATLVVRDDLPDETRAWLVSELRRCGVSP